MRPLHQTGPVLWIFAIGHHEIADTEKKGQMRLRGRAQTSHEKKIAGQLQTRGVRNQLTRTRRFDYEVRRRWQYGDQQQPYLRKSGY